MSNCKIIKNQDGKINDVLNQTGQSSSLFKEILNTPTLSLDEAIQVYQNIYSEKLQKKVQFQILGEKGAQNLDQIEEATSRTDNLKVAREMEAAGKTPKEIRLATGWEKNLADGKYRYEILDGVENNISVEFNKENKSFTNTNIATVLLPELYNNQELYKAYPILKKTPVIFYNDSSFFGDLSGFTWQDRIFLNSKKFIDGQNKYRGNLSNKDDRFTLQHEIQHILQDIEGFDRGTSTKTQEKKIKESLDYIRDNRGKTRNSYDIFLKNYLSKDVNFLERLLLKVLPTDKIASVLAQKFYLSKAGEVEARNVQLRTNFTQQERIETLLSNTQQVPYEKQLVDVSEQDKDFIMANLVLPQENSEKGEITQEIIDKLKQNGLSEDVFLLSTEEINAKLIELGVSEDVRKQVIAWHVSDSLFKKFDSEYIGQKFGTFFGNGFYFASESDVSNYFSNKPILTINGKNIEGTATTYYIHNKKNRNLTDSEFLEALNTSLGEDRKVLEKSFGEEHINNLEVIKNAIENNQKIEIKGRYKYKVKINDNFIDWETQVPDYLLEKLTGDNNYEITGKQLYKELASQLGSERQASQFLLEKGINGMRYPMELESNLRNRKGFGYVVFDENAITIEEQIQFQKSLNNVGINLITNGFTYKDKDGKDIVILNKDTADDSVAIHEFSHIFSKWQKENRPKLWKKGQDLAKDAIKSGEIKDIEDFVKQTQPRLKEGSEAFYDEVLQEFISRESKNMMDEQKSKSPLMQWLSDFWESIKDMLSLTSMTPEQVANLNLREFARATVADLLKGERIKGEEAQEYFVRNADRLPLTLSVFSRPEFKYLQGRMVNPQTVTNYLNQSGIKQIEKDLIKQVIQDNFQGQKKISYDELEAVVRANIMPLERITTTSYSGYGMDNLGNGSYGEAKTLILNAPIEHGVTGHFSGDFKASGRKNIKYQAKQLDANTWVAVEEGYEENANDNNIYQYVGTAGTKDVVDTWINSNRERTVTEEQDFQELKRKEADGELTQQESKEFDELNSIGGAIIFDSVNKGMFGHIRVWQDGQDYYVAELQSDYFQKNNAKRDILDKATRNSEEFGKLQQTATIMGANFREEKAKLEEQNKKELLDFAKKQPNIEFKLQKTFNDDEKYNLRLFIDNKQIHTYRYKFSENQNTEEAEKEIINSTYTVGEYLPQNVVDYKKELENKVLELENKFDKDKNDLNKKIEKIKEGIFNKLSPQEEQFIASQKEWEKRMVREAIKEASLSGATSLRFPTPYTLSVIENYIKGNTLTSTETGDIVEYLGEDYIILDGSEDNHVRIIPVKNMTKVLIEDFEQLRAEGEVGEDEDIYDYYIGDVGEGVESSDGQYFYYNRTYRPQGLETINTNGKKNVTKENFDIETTLDRDKDGNEIEAYNEKTGKYEIDRTQRTVAYKYQEIAQILKTERGDNFETITDNNGFDWYETKIEASETQNPVIAFQVIGQKGASRIEEYQQSLNQAKELEKQGEDYSQTGWYKGVDGWKYLSKEAIEDFKIINKEENKILKLKEVLGDENVLFKIYPEIQDLSVIFLNKNAKGYEKFEPIDEDTRGEFQAENETIRLNIYHQGNRANVQEISFVLGHELAYQIRNIGWFFKTPTTYEILNILKNNAIIKKIEC